MHDDTGAFRALQQAAKHLTAFLARSVAASVHPPRLLAEAAWELWEFARSPAAATARRLGWPGTFDPTAEADAMRRRDVLAGAVAAASALVSDSLIGARPVGPETITGALEVTEGYRVLITTEVARDSMGPLLRHAGRLRDLAMQTPGRSLRDGLLVAHGDALTVAAWVAADGRHVTLARRLARNALAAADDAGSHDLRAYVLAMLGLLVAHQQDDPYGALKLVGKGMDAKPTATWNGRSRVTHPHGCAGLRRHGCSTTAAPAWPASTMPATPRRSCTTRWTGTPWPATTAHLSAPTSRSPTPG